MEEYTRLALTVAALVQTLYALAWCTVRFWRSSIGLSAFFKAWALAAILDVVVVGAWFAVTSAVWAVLASMLAVGICVQFAVFIRERWFSDDGPVS